MWYLLSKYYSQVRLRYEVFFYYVGVAWVLTPTTAKKTGGGAKFNRDNGLLPGSQTV